MEIDPRACPWRPRVCHIPLHNISDRGHGKLRAARRSPPQGGPPTRPWGTQAEPARTRSPAFHALAAVARHAHTQRMRTSLRFPRQTWSAKARRTHRPYSWWRRICRSCRWDTSSSSKCCRMYGEAGGGPLAAGGSGGGAVGGGMNAGASARKPLPAATSGGGNAAHWCSHPPSDTRS